MSTTQRPLRREEAKRLTRHRLLQACRQLLAEQGPDHLTTGGIMRLAGMAQATFYVHFRDIDELLALVATEIVDEMQQALSDIRLRLDHDAEVTAALRQTFRLSLEAVRAHAGLLRLFMSEGLRGNSVLGQCARVLVASLSEQLFQDLRPLALTCRLDDARLRLGADAIVSLTLNTGLGLAEGRHGDPEQAIDMLHAVTLALLAPWPQA